MVENTNILRFYNTIKHLKVITMRNSVFDVLLSDGIHVAYYVMMPSRYWAIVTDGFSTRSFDAVGDPRRHDAHTT